MKEIIYIYDPDAEYSKLGLKDLKEIEEEINYPIIYLKSNQNEILTDFLPESIEKSYPMLVIKGDVIKIQIGYGLQNNKDFYKSFIQRFLTPEGEEFYNNEN